MSFLALLLYRQPGKVRKASQTSKRLIKNKAIYFLNSQYWTWNITDTAADV